MSESHTEPRPDQPVIDREHIDAVVFDMDGVITDTARVHSAAWKLLFDEHLKAHAEATGTEFAEFTDEDYRAYVDGKPRYDGVRSFLASRGIELAEGSADDPPGDGTVQALGNRKNGFFLDELRASGADAYPHAVELVHRLQDAGIGTAIISASANAKEVLEAAGVGDLFSVRVDGVVADEMGLAGKPDPAVFREATNRLDATPERAVVVEDAQAGVEAGSSGGFALVIGVDRGGNEAALRENGADAVVTDLGRVRIREEGRTTAPIGSLPDALGSWDTIAAAHAGKLPAVFLDYDGTLTPIVENPEDAHLHPDMRAALEGLGETSTVAVVSGRDVSFVTQEVALNDILYLGSHGFDIVTPLGVTLSTGREDEFGRFLEPLDAVEHALEAELAEIAGSSIERKKYAVAVHYRQVAEEDVPKVEIAVDTLLADHPELRKSGGKKVFELRPDIDWDKGRAVRWALGALGLDPESTLPVYVGDDLTDEDAFAELAADGLSIVVGTDRRLSAAEYHVTDVDAVRDVLLRLAAFAEEA